MRYIILALCAGTSAAAQCPADQDTFMSCQIAGRDQVLAVCHDRDMVTYTYGKSGEIPELTLSEPTRTAQYTPWSGVTREIAEGVDFHNGTYVYRTFAGFRKLQSGERDDDGVERRFGGVRVMQGDREIAVLRCNPVTLQYGYESGLYAIKEALGLQWDDRVRTWVPAN